jgi:heat-inducible transcriptional repressor
MQAIVSALDDEHVITKSVEDISCATVAIGKENIESALRRCSVVISQFSGESFMGHLGILGPTRLDYRKVQGLVNSFSRHLPKLIK